MVDISFWNKYCMLNLIESYAHMLISVQSDSIPFVTCETTSLEFEPDPPVYSISLSSVCSNFVRDTQENMLLVCHKVRVHTL